MGNCQLWERSDISFHFAGCGAGGAGWFAPSRCLAVIKIDLAGDRCGPHIKLDCQADLLAVLPIILLVAYLRHFGG